MTTAPVGCLDEREAFEVWFCASGDYELEWLDKSGANHALYMDANTENMWQAFQAGVALSHPAPVAAPPSVPQAIDQLVSALAESKGWLRDYARALIEDAIDRRHLEVAAPAPASEALTPPST